MEIVYNDCDAALESEFAKYMNPHSLLAFATPATPLGWADKGSQGLRREVSICAHAEGLLQSLVATGFVARED